MYTDNTLTPKEAVRLCALGTLIDNDLSYSELATSIRHFVSHIIGPSLDVMGQSIELLKYEGLVKIRDDNNAPDDSMLTITERGREEFFTLATAQMRFGSTELNKLLIALKFRFLHLLDGDQQIEQIGHLEDLCENELARLCELRAYHANDDGFIVSWLDHDMSVLEDRLKWLSTEQQKISNPT